MSFDATVQALDELCADARQRRSRSGYFGAMYGRVTRTVRARAAAGQFRDANRMEALVTTFADRYLDAHRDWRAGHPVTASWEAAFAVVDRWPPIVLQHLLVGMNAHINLDLGIATAMVGREHGGLANLRSDFDAINDVLASLVDRDQAALNRVSPWFGLADRLGGSTDELMFRFSLRQARSEAWAFAARLDALAPAAWDAAISQRDAAVAQLAHRVLHPGGRIGAALFAVRLRETRSVPDVIDALGADG